MKTRYFADSESHRNFLRAGADVSVQQAVLDCAVVIRRMDKGILAGDDDRPDRILADIDRAQVGVVVINHAICIPSGPMPPELLNPLRSQFPESETIDNFEIRWK